MQSKVTTPALKYGPTAEYGDCEVESCESNARMTCAACDGHFCFGHGGHPAGAAPTDQRAHQPLEA